MNQEVVKLHLADIIPNRFQPREVFDENALKELAISIKEHGVIQPIIVRKVNDKYEIIAGERRYKAASLAGLEDIPAIVKELDDKESSKVGLLENLQRRDLNPIEEAKTYKKILELDNMTQDALAKTMGKSQSSVANKLRLLNLSNEVQDALLKANISERHARSLLRVEDQAKQNELLNKIINEKLSVRSLEEEIDKIVPKKETPTVPEVPDVPTEPEPQDISVTNEFINSNPLNPTTEITKPAEEDNRIKIIGPDGEETNQFINYGEIETVTPEETTDLPPGAPGQIEPNPTPAEPVVPDVDETTDLNNEEVVSKYINYGEVGKEQEPEPVEQKEEFKPIDIDMMKENATDIGTKQESTSPSSSIDNLLNINIPQVPTDFEMKKDEKAPDDNPEVKEEQDQEQYITPAEKIVKTEAEIDEEDDRPTGDYFKPSDLASVELPDSIDTSSKTTDQVNLSEVNQTESNNPMTLNEAKQALRNTVEDIKGRGINISTNEMDFNTNYQMIIKIEKNQ